jgi:hypothetical protein
MNFDYLAAPIPLHPRALGRLASQRGGELSEMEGGGTKILNLSQVVRRS